jgi:hypothetical protein
MRIVSGAVVGGLVVAVLAYMLWARPLNEARLRMASVDTPEELQAAAAAMKRGKPRYTTITLQRSPDSSRCIATIEPPDVGGYPGEPVKWTIAQHEENPCLPGGPWAVWLVFEGSSLPFPQREMRIGRSSRAIPINGNATYGNYTYKVWMRDQNGLSNYELIDPVLEVEDPPRIYAQ